MCVHELWILFREGFYWSKTNRVNLFQYGNNLLTVLLKPTPTLLGTFEVTTIKMNSTQLFLAPMYAPLLFQFDKWAFSTCRIPTGGTLMTIVEAGRGEGIKTTLVCEKITCFAPRSLGACNRGNHGTGHSHEHIALEENLFWPRVWRKCVNGIWQIYSSKDTTKSAKYIFVVVFVVVGGRSQTRMGLVHTCPPPSPHTHT